MVGRLPVMSKLASIMVLKIVIMLNDLFWLFSSFLFDDLMSLIIEHSFLR